MELEDIDDQKDAGQIHDFIGRLSDERGVALRSWVEGRRLPEGLRQLDMLFSYVDGMEIRFTVSVLPGEPPAEETVAKPAPQPKEMPSNARIALYELFIVAASLSVVIGFDARKLAAGFCFAASASMPLWYRWLPKGWK